MNKAGVPCGGIALTAAVAALGVVLNALVPAEAFEIVLNIASLGIISTWGMIILCQMQLARLAARGELVRPAFRMPGAPVTGWITLVFLLAVLVLMAFDSPVGTWTVVSLVVVIPALMLGWRLCRDRVLEIAAVRDGYTGPFPLVADRPVRGTGGDAD